jgi:hypothetical protein
MKRIIFILTLLVGLVSFGVAEGSDQPPEQNFMAAGAPASVGVDGPDGEAVVCANGKELRISKATLLARPTHDPTKVRPATSRKGDSVWRCGTAANPDRNPELVPVAEDPLTTAP